MYRAFRAVASRMVCRSWRVEGIPIRYELEDFLSSILHDHPPRGDVASGARTVATVLAGLKAQEAGHPLKVPEVD